jgi:DNA-binding XRE family transcriptional regulator
LFPILETILYFYKRKISAPPDTLRQILSRNNTCKYALTMSKITKKKLKITTLEELKDIHIGKVGTTGREKYEYELRMELLGQMIKKTRQERNLTQEALGKLIGVQRAQISKLESNTTSATIASIIKVFQALNAEIHFHVSVDGKNIAIG